MGRSRKTDKHLPKRMYLRSGSYYLVDYFNKWHNLGRVYVKAMAEYGRLTDPDKPCKTIGDLLDRYLLEVAPTKSERTYKNKLWDSRCLRAALAHIQIDLLTAKIIYQYVDARIKTPVAANRELALLSHMYKKAIRWGYTETNPCIGIERYQERPRDRYVEDWEYQAFKDFAGPLISVYMEFKLLTGLRRGDILSLKLSQIKDDGIHAYISKSKKTQIFAWTDALELAVKNIKKLDRPVKGFYLFITKKGQPYTGSGFASIWQRKMRAALEEGIITDRFREHDLRAKTASDTNLQHASDLLAHGDEKTTERVYMRKPKNVTPLR